MKLSFRILLPILLISGILPVAAQPYFTRYDSIPVSINNTLIKYPWAGGLNSCQFSTIDMNMDGIEDLFVFDRAGNKISTFINNGTAGMTDYRFAPEYRKMFVNQHDSRGSFHDWILLRDYDMDGKKDIFTYSNGAAAVYRNTTTTADSLTFELKTTYLKSNYNPNYLSLYISPVDMPTFIDVDNDNDLDVLTFHIYGTVIEFHSNQSQELYGHSDSLTYMLYDNCWGDFSENSTSNSVFLDTCINVFINGDSIEEVRSGGSRHSGSSTLALDLNDNGVKEFMLGDISFNNLTVLYNDGTLLDAHMNAQSTAGPPGTTPTNLPVFPAAFYEDINNDSVKDLIVSPNTTNITENFTSVWLYNNNGTTSLPEFSYTQNNFLQDNMIEVGEVSFPVFFDADNDGLKDLIIGNYGYFSATPPYKTKLSYYRNTGTAISPAFQLVTRNYANIESIGTLKSIYPAFGDIDNDGVLEMLLGVDSGFLHLFENNASPGQPANFVLSEAYFDSIDVGLNATPQLFDVNGDTLLDLIIGERNGNLNYYENTGTSNNPEFTLISEDFGGVDVRNSNFNIGYSVPFMFRHNNSLQLFAGSESGEIHQYTGIEETMDAGNSLSAEIGQGTTVSPDAHTTPFGSQFRNGRNQFLVKAEELQTAGFQYGIIKKLAFNVEQAAGGTLRGFKIGLANWQNGDITNFEELNFTTVYANDAVISATGWKEFSLTQKFVWDASSDVIVQVCFDTTLSTIGSSTVFCTTTPFISNVGASADNTAGCTMSSGTAGSLRPNMKFTLRPSFPEKGVLALFEGVHSSICGTDLDNDSLMDIVIGNYTGGVSYYKGDTTGITTGIKNTIPVTEAVLYPNPCNENITLSLSEPFNENVTADIYNLTGQLLQSFPVPRQQQATTFNTSLFTSGVYALVIRTKTGTLIKKFVVSH